MMFGWSGDAKRGRTARRLVVLAGLAVSGALVSFGTGGAIGNLDGPLYDLSLAVAAPFARPATVPVPVTIVALDRRSLASDELGEVPRVLMAP